MISNIPKESEKRVKRLLTQLATHRKSRAIAKLFDSRRPLGHGRTPRLELWIPAFAGKTGWGHILLYGRTLQSS